MEFKHLIFKIFLIFVTTLTIGCSPADNSQNPQLETVQDEHISVRGLLLGVDGTPMKSAHVLVQPLVQTGNDSIEVIEAVNGSYQLSLNNTQHYKLTYRGVGHLPMSIIYTPDFHDISGLNISLDNNIDKSQFDELYIKIYTDSSFKKSIVEPLKLNDAGAYVAELDVSAGNTHYRIRGIGMNGENIANPNGNSFFHHKEYGYFSTLKHSGGKLTFKYQPSKQQQLQAAQSVSVNSSAKDKLGHVLLFSHFDRLYREKAAAEAQAKKEKGAETEFVYQKGLEQIAQWREQFQSEIEQQLISILSIDYYGYYTNTDFVNKALKEVEKSSSLWSFYPSLYASAIIFSEKLESDYYSALINIIGKNPQLVEQFLAENNDIEAKGNLVFLLAYAHQSQKNVDQAFTYTELLKTDYSQTHDYDFYLDSLIGKSLPLGQKVPNFSIASLKQPEVIYQQSSFEGQVYLVDFWATWCSPCIKQMPALHEAYTKFNKQGFEILSLSADEVVSDIDKFRQESWEMPWKHAFLDNGKHPITEDFMVKKYPTVYLVNDKGEVIATGEDVKGSNLSKTLENYYATKEESE